MYDIVVVGSGVSSLFFLHTLKDSGHKILVLEKGVELTKRFCPKVNDSICKCKTCYRHYGTGGPLKNEGKFNYTNDFGGSLGEKIGNELSLSYQSKVDEILMSYCKSNVELYSTYNEEINDKAKKSNLEVLTTKVRHLGIENTYQTFSDLYSKLKNTIEFRFNIDEINIVKNDEIFIINNVIKTKKIVIATNTFDVSKICPTLNLEQGDIRLDIGLRVEMLAEQWNNLLKDTFETKLKYNNSYTYCMNPYGRVVKKVQDGYEFADGQNCKENNSNNLNFTLFYPEYFANQKIADKFLKQLMQALDNKIIVQQLGNFKNNNQKQTSNYLEKTLDAQYGDISKVIAPKYMDNLLMFLDKLSQLIEQEIHDETHIYAIDVKFYSPIIQTDKTLQTSVNNFYVIGDCSGITSSLSQAAASGLYLGDIFKDNINNIQI